MNVTGLTPLLRTWDLDATIAFYRDVLGFVCDAHSVDDGWASLSRDGVKVMLSGPNVHEGDTKPAFTGSLYFTTDDLEAFWLRVKDSARVCYPIENFEYGMREFGIYDSNGYLLQFGQPLHSNG